MATAAQWIARELGSGDPQRAFLGGILHDVGRVLALRVLEDATIRDPQVRRHLSKERIASVITAHQAQLGAALLEKCGFPEDLVLMARLHHAPTELAPGLVLPQLVALADIAARAARLDITPPEADEAARHPLARRLGLGRMQIDTLLTQLADLQARTKQLLAP